MQQNITCPVCGNIHKIDILRSGSRVVAIACPCFSTEDKKEIKEIMDNQPRFVGGGTAYIPGPDDIYHMT